MTWQPGEAWRDVKNRIANPQVKDLFCKAGRDALKDRQSARAGEVAEWRVVEYERVHDRWSNSGRKDSSGMARCSGRSSMLTVPHSSSVARAAVSLPAW